MDDEVFRHRLLMNSICYIQGMEYSATPGMYLYPQNEGRFLIEEKPQGQWLLSYPNLAGMSYSHPNRQVITEKTLNIDLGWYSYFICIC